MVHEGFLPSESVHVITGRDSESGGGAIVAVGRAASVSWHGRAMVGTEQPWGERVDAMLRQGDSQSLYLLSWFVVPWKF